VSQTTEHGWYERLLEDLIRAACQIVGVRLEKCGGATWKRPSLSKGVEADASYYIENAGRIIGKRRIDLESDPPPDVVVEVEVTTNSDYKLPVYAALKVPEVWRYDGQSFRFYRLEKGKYVQAPASRFLQGLAGQMLADALEAGKTIGQDAALNAFRRKFRSSQAGRKHR
jgi:Uma2 family endonuclease